MKDYYPIKIQKNGRAYFCIWYTNDTDGIIFEEEKVKSFYSFQELTRYCMEQTIFLNEEIVSYDLDNAIEWTSSCEKNIDCKIILNLWNLMSDLAQSIDEVFCGDDDKYIDIYDKLFYGNNLPAINRSDELYYPKWSKKEFNKIQNIIKNGIELFEKYLV